MGWMPQHTAIGRDGFFRPTEAQIRSNIFVVPKAFINKQRQRLRWFHGFDVVIREDRFTNRKLDMENRIGGIALRHHFRGGQLLKLEIVDGVTLRIRPAQESEIGEISDDADEEILSIDRAP